jgi:hypothetical protein
VNENARAFVVAVAMAITVALATIAAFGPPMDQRQTTIAAMSTAKADAAINKLHTTMSASDGDDPSTSDQRRLDMANRTYLVGAVGAVAFGALGMMVSLFIYYYSGKVSEAQSATIRQLRTASKVAAADLARAQLEIVRITHARVITPEQETAVLRLLADAPKGTVVVTAALIDGEATNYAKRLKDVLQTAGYHVSDPPQSMLSISNAGLNIVVKDTANPPLIAGPLRHALMVGLDTQVTPLNNANLSPSDVWIAIGPKF